MDEPSPSTGIGRLLRSYYLVALFIGLFLLVLARFLGTGAAPGAHGSVLGTVTDLDDGTLANITVSLSGATDIETLSDPTGRFVFSGLTPGSYRMEAYGRGYPKRVFDEPVLVRPGRSTTVHIQLRNAVREILSPVIPDATDQPDGPVPRPPDGADHP